VPDELRRLEHVRLLLHPARGLRQPAGAGPLGPLGGQRRAALLGKPLLDAVGEHRRHGARLDVVERQPRPLRGGRIDFEQGRQSLVVVDRATDDAEERRADAVHALQRCERVLEASLLGRDLRQPPLDDE
jgi:hypothetical protein